MRFIIYCFILFGCIGCSRERILLDGLPFRLEGGEQWGIVGKAGELICHDILGGRPSVVVNGRFVLADTMNRKHLYAYDGKVKRLSGTTYRALGYFFDEVTIGLKEYEEPLVVLDRQGNEVCVLANYLGQRITVAHNFKEGRALVYTTNGKYGYVDTRGNMVIAPNYDYACDFSEGLALVGELNVNGRLVFRVIDRDGNTCFPLAMQNCRIQNAFSEGYLLFRNLQQGYCGALDRHGKVVMYFPASVRDVFPYRNGVAIFWTDRGMGLMNKKGEEVIPPIYEDGEILGDNRVALKLKGKWGIFDFEGRLLDDLKYERIIGRDDCIVALRDSVFVLLDGNGREIAGTAFAEVAWDSRMDRIVSQVFSVHEPQVYPVEKDVVEPQVKPEKKKAEYPRLEQARINVNNPFYNEAARLWKGGLQEGDAKNRQVILNYMEHFRMSYVTKDIDFLEQLFSEKALIIVGNVVKQATVGHNYLSSKQVRYNVRTKREYLDRLREIFEKNKAIDVEFTDFTIKRHPTKEGIYGVSVKQRYASDLYSDEGYLFLLWDFREQTAPKIHVRTWQPRMLDEHTPLPEQEIFNIGSFNLE